MYWHAIQLGQIAGWGIASATADHAGTLELHCHSLSREEASALAAELNRQPLPAGAKMFPTQPAVDFTDPITASSQAFAERRCLICDAPIVGPRRETRVTCGRPCCVVQRAHQLRSLTPAPR